MDQKGVHNIDFRVPGLSHSVVKEAEHIRRLYNPFSKDSKEMSRELGNVELFELCETTPQVQCSHCPLCGNQGIVYCPCGQCLIYSECRRKFNKPRLDALSIPDYVIKKGATHGARHGKTEV